MLLSRPPLHPRADPVAASVGTQTTPPVGRPGGILRASDSKEIIDEGFVIVDAPDATDAADAPDATDAADAPDATGAPDAPDATDAADAPDAPDATGAPDAPDATDAADAPDAPDAPDAADAADHVGNGMPVITAGMLIPWGISNEIAAQASVATRLHVRDWCDRYIVGHGGGVEKFFDISKVPEGPMRGACAARVLQAAWTLYQFRARFSGASEEPPKKKVRFSEEA